MNLKRKETLALYNGYLVRPLSVWKIRAGTVYLYLYAYLLVLLCHFVKARRYDVLFHCHSHHGLRICQLLQQAGCSVLVILRGCKSSLYLTEHEEIALEGEHPLCSPPWYPFPPLSYSDLQGLSRHTGLDITLLQASYEAILSGLGAEPAPSWMEATHQVLGGYGAIQPPIASLREIEGPISHNVEGGASLLSCSNTFYLVRSIFSDQAPALSPGDVIESNRYETFSSAQSRSFHLILGSEDDTAMISQQGTRCHIARRLPSYRYEVPYLKSLVPPAQEEGDYSLAQPRPYSCGDVVNLHPFFFPSSFNPTLSAATVALAVLSQPKPTM